MYSLFRKPERESHSSPSKCSHDTDAVSRAHAHERLLGVLRIDPVPSLRDLHIRRFQERPDIAKYQVVNPRLVEHIDGAAVLMRIPKGQLTVCGLWNQPVDDPVIVLRALFRDSLPQALERRANGKRAVESQCQACSERRTKLPPVWLRPGPHHLELASIDSALSENLWIEGLKVIAVADYRVLDFPFLGTGFNNGEIDGSDNRSVRKLDAELGRQELGQLPQNQSWIYRQLNRAP